MFPDRNSDNSFKNEGRNSSVWKTLCEWSTVLLFFGIPTTSSSRWSLYMILFIGRRSLIILTRVTLVATTGKKTFYCENRPRKWHEWWMEKRGRGACFFQTLRNGHLHFNVFSGGHNTKVFHNLLRRRAGERRKEGCLAVLCHTE